MKCLGLTCKNDQERREHFIALPKEKLQDPEIRKRPGLHQGSDAAILQMSNPPYSTACPNPFLNDYVYCYSKPYTPDEIYQREPFAVDVSVGKTDQPYKTYPYHIKAPHLAAAMATATGKTRATPARCCPPASTPRPETGKTEQAYARQNSAVRCDAVQERAGRYGTEQIRSEQKSCALRERTSPCGRQQGDAARSGLLSPAQARRLHSSEWPKLWPAKKSWAH